MGAVKHLLFECVEEITNDFDLQDEVFEAVCEGDTERLQDLVYRTEGHLKDEVKQAWTRLLGMFAPDIEMDPLFTTP